MPDSSNQPKRKRIINIAVNVLLVGFLLLVLFSTDAKSWVLQQLVNIGVFQAEIKTPKDNGEMNTVLSFQDESGRIQSTADLKGKVVFINFWASWCPPCRAEMPTLNELYKRLKDDDRYVLLFINEDNEAAPGKNYLQKNNFNLPFMTAAGNVPVVLFNGALPTTVVLNKAGKLVMHHEGLANYSTDDFIKQLEVLAGN